MIVDSPQFRLQDCSCGAFGIAANSGLVLKELDGFIVLAWS